MTKRVAILISGSGSNMVTLIEAMQAGRIDADPVLVLSNVPDAPGLSKAAALGVPTAVVDHRDYHGDREKFDGALQAALMKAQPDIVCLAGFMRILTPEFIAKWEGRMLNIHPSLLPKYRGLHTHKRAIEAGDRIAGCSVHLVTPELDAGPVLGQAEVDIFPDDTPETLAARVLAQEHRLYPSVLADFVRQ